MKRIMILISVMAMVIPMMARPDAESDGNNMSNKIGNRYYYWQADVFGEDGTTLIITPGGIFDDPADLTEIVERTNIANQRGMTYAEFAKYNAELNQYIADHPRYAKNGYVHLGHLNNAVNPSALRNRHRALTYYQMVESADVNKTDLAQLYILMASCFQVAEDKCNIHQMSNYYMKAAKADLRFASLMGHKYLFGWGCYSDLNLAAHYYTIGMINGDRGAANYLRIIQYIAQHQKLSALDSSAFLDFENFAYLTRVEGKSDLAFSSLASAAQKGFVPAFQFVAEAFRNHQTVVGNPDQIRNNTFSWLRRGIAANYAPSLYSLAIMVGEDYLDSLKGDIYKRDKNGTISEKDKKECAKQSFELLGKANATGNTIAMVEMGDRYLAGDPYGYPEKSLKKALICYVTAAKCGSKEAAMKVKKIRNENSEEITNAYMQVIEEATLILRGYISSMIIDLFTAIDNHPYYRVPHIIPNTFIANSGIGVDTEDPLYAVSLSEGYTEAYKMYANEVKDLTHGDHIFEQENGPMMQTLMRNLRMYSLRLPIPVEINQSKWETWSEK